MIRSKYPASSKQSQEVTYLDENYQKLANAIILQAVKDFKPAYRRLKNHPNDRLAQDTVREITKFFCSQYFEALSDLDGPALLSPSTGMTQIEQPPPLSTAYRRDYPGKPKPAGIAFPEPHTFSSIRASL